MNGQKEYRYDLSLDNDGVAARTLKLVGPQKRVLELGCSVGTQSKILKEQLGCTVVGIEINPEAAIVAAQFCERIIVGNIDQLNITEILETDKFDAILCADVLEHLYNPAKILEELSKLLTSNGYVVSSIPNVVHSAVILEMARGNFEYRSAGLLDDSHIRFFTRSSVFSMFTGAGYEITHFDRGLVDPIWTEIDVSISNQSDQLFLDYIHANNPESRTYHFIIKAKPSSLPISTLAKINGDFEELTLSELRTQNGDLQNESATRIHAMQKAHSELEWLESTFAYSIWTKASLIRNSVRNALRRIFRRILT